MLGLVMKEAQDRGATEFDLGGSADQGWIGFTRNLGRAFLRLGLPCGVVAEARAEGS